VSSARSIEGFVLAGGKSRRMGRNKALLELHGRPLALRAGDLLRPWVAAVTLVGSPGQRVSLGMPILTDLFPDRGPLGGICTGLEQSRCDWNVFLACDMPFVEGTFVRFLRERALMSDADAVLPKTEQSLEPLCAAYHRRCLPVMRRVLETSQGGVVDALKQLRVEVIPTGQLAAHGFSEEMFADVDTGEDWSEIVALSKAPAPGS
jgi:molybdopterin-guanine dinucleotide biosynthesis protein A